jgi:hypothetical protein
VACRCEHDGEHLDSIKFLNLLSSREYISYSRRTPLHGVSWFVGWLVFRNYVNCICD